MRETRTTDASLAAAMVAGGARLVRHGHDMALYLTSVAPSAGWLEPELPAGLRLTGLREAASRLAAASYLAYAPGHPDAPRSPADAQERARELLGGAGGPILEPPSAAVAAAGDSIVAAVAVTRQGPLPWGWEGGTWVADIFVVPALRGSGLGRSLLRRAIAWSRAEGERWIGLTVTEGNPAERLYLGVGFRRRRTVFVLETPDNGSRLSPGSEEQEEEEGGR
jgi:GNAT superfamily N-acetyltransferase